MIEQQPYPSVNGQPPAPAGPVARRRVEWVDLPPEAEVQYPGFKIKLWANYERSLIRELQSGNNDRMRHALRKMVLEHNGWQRELDDGSVVPFSPANSDEFWEEIPDEMAAILIVMVQRESTKLPNSLVATNRR